MLRIAFDIGGVLSKYPDLFRSLIQALNYTDTHSVHATRNVEIYIISDIKPKEKAIAFLKDNGFYNDLFLSNILVADYNKYGEACKAVLCKEYAIDIFVDDHLGYLTPKSGAVRLLVMPDDSRPYYAASWKTDGSEGNFGRTACSKEEVL